MIYFTVSIPTGMRRLPYLYLFIALLLASKSVTAQVPTAKKQQDPAEVKKAAINLEKSLLENDNPKIARNYEVLAQELADKDELPRAEDNLLKALEIYVAAKDVTGRARVLRSIARVQESQHKMRAAKQNFKSARDGATDGTTQLLNSNDFRRLENPDNPASAEKYLNSNIALLKRIGKKGELSDTYIQMAKLQLKSNDSVNGLENYMQALRYADNIPGKKINIYGELAAFYVAGKEYDKAITTVEDLLAETVKIKDVDNQIIQLQYLAGIYFEKEDTENGIKTLEKAYEIAATNGRTFEARESLVLLTEYYKSTENDSTSIELYEKFIKNLDRIILSDTSLTDAKTFRVTEERIRRLESEKALKDELITKRTTFNYVLLISVVLLLLFFGFIVKTLYSIKRKNKEIALQSLRREMNPHFLFNSLNSVNQFIAQNNELEANKFLTSYSNLMRSTMENSNKDFVTLASELDSLKKYLELEHLRFRDKFDFEINVDDRLDRETIWIPNMILQPHVENAIWHGLRYKEGKGLLKVNFMLDGTTIVITVDDDGIGITKSAELKTHNQRAHESRGMTNTKERLDLLNDLYKTKLAFSINEKKSPETGTIVEITFPIIERP